MNAAGALAGLVVAAALGLLAGRWVSGGRIGAVALRGPSTGGPEGGAESGVAGGVAGGPNQPMPRRGALGRSRMRRAGGRSGPARGGSGRGGPRGGAGAGLVVDVAAAVRAGVSPAGAWAAAGVACGVTGVPVLAAMTGAGLGASDARAVVSGCWLAHQLGAPLAPVLEGVAELIDEQAELAGERAATAAGPRSSIRVMTGLPLACAAVGVVMGADPVHVLLVDGPGRAVLATGAALLWGGRRWARALVRSAERAGRE